jgi:hypothetical protein
MKTRAVMSLFIAFFAAGCPGPDPENPPKLWLYLDGSETEVKLIDREPEPF